MLPTFDEYVSFKRWGNIECKLIYFKMFGNSFKPQRGNMLLNEFERIISVTSFITNDWQAEFRIVVLFNIILGKSSAKGHVLYISFQEKSVTLWKLEHQKKCWISQLWNDAWDRRPLNLLDSQFADFSPVNIPKQYFWNLFPIGMKATFLVYWRMPQRLYSH